MVGLFVGFIVAAILMLIEYLLCTRLKSPLWGGIIPLFILAGTIYIFVSGLVPFELKNVFPFIIANTLFFGDWGTGREKYKKLRQAEMDKMKAIDI